MFCLRLFSLKEANCHVMRQLYGEAHMARDQRISITMGESLEAGLSHSFSSTAELSVEAGTPFDSLT